MCNAVFLGGRGRLLLSGCDDLCAEPADQAVQALIGAAFGVLTRGGCKYIVQYTYDISGLWHQIIGAGGVEFIENETAVGAGQTIQRKNIPMLLEKSPYLRLFPLPALSQGFQG